MCSWAHFSQRATWPPSAAVGEPRLTECFPQFRDLILKGRFRDPAIYELCKDYDALIEARDAENSWAELDETVRERLVELLRLIWELEKEALIRLRRYEQREHGRNSK